MKMLRIILFILAVFPFNNSASASKLQIDLIKEAMNAVCGTFSNSGSSQKFSIKGDAGVELSSIIKQLADIGIKGAAEFDSEEYIGVLRGELSDELKSVRVCRERIWKDLYKKFTQSENNDSLIKETSWKSHECDYLVPALKFDPDEGVPLRGNIRLIPTSTNTVSIPEGSTLESNSLFPDFDFNRSINSCRDAVREFPSNGRYYYLLGVSHLMNGDEDSGLYYMDVAYNYKNYVAGTILGLFSWREDREKAINLFFEAANSGFVDAMLMIIWVESEGELEISSSELKKWAEKAANKGDYMAMAVLGQWGLNGMHGVSKYEGDSWSRKSMMQEGKPLID